MKNKIRPTLTGLFFENFQAIKEPTFLRLAPLTFLYGPNSVGKSAVGDAMEFLSQLTSPRSPHLLSLNVPAYSAFAFRDSGDKDVHRNMTLGFQFKIPDDFTNPEILERFHDLATYQPQRLDMFRNKTISVQFHATSRSSATLAIAVDDTPLLEISTLSSLKQIDIHRSFAYLETESWWEDYDYDQENQSVTFYESFWDYWWGDEDRFFGALPSKKNLFNLAIDQVREDTLAEATLFRKVGSGVRVYGVGLERFDWYDRTGDFAGREYVPLELLGKEIGKELASEYRDCWGLKGQFSDNFIKVNNRIKDEDPFLYFFTDEELEGGLRDRSIIRALRRIQKERQVEKKRDEDIRDQYAHLAREFSYEFIDELSRGVKTILHTGNIALRAVEVNASRKVLDESDTFRIFAETGSVVTPPFSLSSPSLLNSYMALGCRDKVVHPGAFHSVGLFGPLSSLEEWAPFDSSGKSGIRLEQIATDLSKITSASGGYRPIFQPYEIKEAFNRFPHVKERKREVKGYFCHLRLKNKNDAVLSFEDVGSGVSYVLPILIALRLCDKNCYIHQPELHLGPKSQLELAEVVWDSKTDSACRILETHSEHLMLRIKKILRDRAKKGDSDSGYGMVSVNYFQQIDGKTVIKEVRLGPSGNFIDRWPGGFFSERLDEIL